MVYSPLRGIFTGIVIGVIIMALSNDYVIISRRRYEKLKEKSRNRYE